MGPRGREQGASQVPQRQGASHVHYIDEAVTLVRKQVDEATAGELLDFAHRVGLTEEARKFLSDARGGLNDRAHPAALKEVSEEAFRAWLKDVKEKGLDEIAELAEDVFVLLSEVRRKLKE